MAIEPGGVKVLYAVFLMIVLVAIMAYVLRHTAWGRHVYAVGDDPEAAELAGVSTQDGADPGLCAGRACSAPSPAG